jgi:hyperosmotically inducible protein
MLFPWIAVVVGVALAVGCSATDPGLTTKVKMKMAGDDAVKAYQIDVDTKDGVVTLTGNIDSQEAKDRALQLARETEGVRSVVDMIEVRTAKTSGDSPDGGDRTFGETIDDAGITMSVKTQLLDDPLVKGLKIDVDTKNGVVYLTGAVKSETEKQKAIELASRTKGVKEVKANLTLS